MSINYSMSTKPITDTNFKMSRRFSLSSNMKYSFNCLNLLCISTRHCPGTCMKVSSLSSPNLQTVSANIHNSSKYYYDPQTLWVKFKQPLKHFGSYPFMSTLGCSIPSRITNSLAVSLSDDPTFEEWYPSI